MQATQHLPATVIVGTHGGQHILADTHQPPGKPEPRASHQQPGKIRSRGHTRRGNGHQQHRQILRVHTDLRLSVLDAGCAVQGTEDVFKLPMMNEECFKKELRKNFASYFNNMPGLVDHVSRLTDEQWSEFYLNWITASRVSSPALGMVETADLRTGVMIMHYAEVLFTTYDANHDGRLDLEETQAAAPRFMGLLKEMSPVKNETFVTQAFIALVFTGKKPDAWAMGSYVGDRLLEWIGINNRQTADRSNILRVCLSSFW